MAGDRGGGEPAGGAGVGGAGRCAACPGGRRGAGPVLAGAVRVAEEQGRLLGVWRTSPLQALARLHVLAAADLVGEPELGRPRPGARRRRRASRCSRTWSRAGRRPPRRWSSPSSTASCWPWHPSVRRTAWWPGRRPGWRRWRPGWTRRDSRCRRSGTCGGSAEYRDSGRRVRGRDRRRDRRVGAALLRAVGGGSARGAVDRRGPLTRDNMSRAAPRKAPPGYVRVPGIQACTTCRDGGLGVRRPDTQAHDDMPPAACRAWRARSSHTEPGSGRTGASLPHRPWPTRSP